jgi:hypothetical protein
MQPIRRERLLFESGVQGCRSFDVRFWAEGGPASRSEALDSVEAFAM